MLKAGLFQFIKNLTVRLTRFVLKRPGKEKDYAYVLELSMERKKSVAFGLFSKTLKFYISVVLSYLTRSFILKSFRSVISLYILTQIILYSWDFKTQYRFYSFPSMHI